MKKHIPRLRYKIQSRFRNKGEFFSVLGSRKSKGGYIKNYLNPNPCLNFHLEINSLKIFNVPF